MHTLECLWKYIIIKNVNWRVIRIWSSWKMMKKVLKEENNANVPKLVIIC